MVSYCSIEKATAYEVLTRGLQHYYPPMFGLCTAALSLVVPSAGWLVNARCCPSHCYSPFACAFPLQVVRAFRRAPELGSCLFPRTPSHCDASARCISVLCILHVRGDRTSQNGPIHSSKILRRVPQDNWQSARSFPVSPFLCFSFA